MKIVTSLSFRGQCREAFEFYAKVLGGKIRAGHTLWRCASGHADHGREVQDVADALLARSWRPGADGRRYGRRMGSNIEKPKNGFDVTLHTDDKAEAKRWFDQLSEGGKQAMPFGETFWSPGFGSLIDKFGIPWMINVIPSAEWKPPQG